MSGFIFRHTEKNEGRLLILWHYSNVDAVTQALRDALCNVNVL